MEVSGQLSRFGRFIPGEISPWYPLYGTLGVPQIQYERYGEEENLLLLPQSNPDYSVVQTTA
jgi:hypothetical protein